MLSFGTGIIKFNVVVLGFYGVIPLKRIHGSEDQRLELLRSEKVLVK